MLLTHQDIVIDEACTGIEDRRPISSARQNLNGAKPTGTAQAEERAAVERFAARVNALGPLSQASQTLQACLLAEVKTVARYVDGSAEAGMASGYDRRVLHEDPTGWSLAAIILRPGQHTHPHDHDGWGCAVTLQGMERNRRFVKDAADTLLLSDERDYPQGTGYIFDAADVHQPLGADPSQVTVALHFLAPATRV